MRLAGWHVERFAGLRDVRHSLPLAGRGGLTLVVGPNEAGKSTLFRFVTGALFGGEPGAVGTLRVEADGAVYTVRRTGDRRQPLDLRDADGRPRDPALLQELLGGVDAQVFRTVFAFGLSELQALKSLTADGVQEKIFSAGIVGAGASAQEALRSLDQEALGLLKPRAASAVGEALEALREADRQLSERLGLAAHYERLVEREAEQAARIARLDNEVRAAGARAAHLGIALDVWPAWTARQEALVELEVLEPTEGFPADAPAALERARATERQARANVEDLENDLAEAGRRRAVLEPDPGLLEAGPAVLAVAAGLALHRDRLARLPEERARLADAAGGLQERLARLGAGWDVARVRSFDRSIDRSAELRGFQSRLDAAVAARIESERLARAARERLADLAGRAVPAAPSPEAVAARETVLARLEPAAARARADVGALRSALDRAESLRTSLASLPAHGAAGSGRRSSRLPVVAAAAVLGALAAWLAAAADWAPAAVSLVLAVAALVWSWPRREAAVAAPEPGGGLAARAADLRRRLENAELEEGGLRERLAKDLAALGLPVAADAAALEERALELGRLRQELEAGRLVRRAADDLAAERGAAVERRDEADRELSEAQTALEQERDAWTRWCVERGIPAGEHPLDAQERFGTIARAQERADARDDAERAVRLLEREVGLWEAAAGAALASCGDPGARPGSVLAADGLPAAVELLAGRLSEAREAHVRAGELDESITDLRGRLDTARGRLEDASREVGRILRSAGAADDAGLARRAFAHEARAARLALVAESSRALAARAGSQARELQATLEQAQPLAWEAESRQCRERQEDLQRQRDDSIAARAEAELERRALEGSEDIAMLGLRRNALELELRRLLRRYAVVNLAEKLVGDTLREYERTRGPQVLRHASQVFAGVTAGRYGRVLPAEGRIGLRVQAADGAFADAGTLSRGTQEQLYVSVRLGLARSLGEQAARLPLVMDDVLVNADRERAAALARSLCELAAEHQVIVLTCHAHVVDLFLDADPGCFTVSLPRLHAAEGPVPAGSLFDDEPGPGTGDLLAFLRAHGGALTALEIRQALDLDQAGFAGLVDELVERGLVRRSGLTRGTRYQAAPAGG